jgi:hypothetical protein
MHETSAKATILQMLRFLPTNWETRYLQDMETFRKDLDFRELVAFQDVNIPDDKGELASEALLTAMDQPRSGKSPLGASWRRMAAGGG